MIVFIIKYSYVNEIVKCSIFYYCSFYERTGGENREKYNRFVVSGSVFAWNPTGFNDRYLLVFLTLDDKLRFQHLRQREIERTGESSLWLDMHGNQTNDFLDWCKTYYTANDPSKIGTFAEHTYQMNHSSSPVLKVNSDQSLEELYQTIMRFVIK